MYLELAWNEPTDCRLCNGTEANFADEIVTTFDLTLTVSDSVNQPSEWVIPVELFNEMPNASLILHALGNLSEDIVTLTSTTIDPRVTT